MAEKTEKEIRNVREDAAADAAHDFSGSRGHFKLTDMWPTYKKIGIPTEWSQAKQYELLSEWPLLNNFLNFADPSIKSETDYRKAFITYVTTEGRTFNRAADTYTVDTLLVAEGEEEGEEGGRKWLLRGETLYDSLIREESEIFTFTIDAASVSIAEGLLYKENEGDQPTRQARYILTREGIVDAATKANKSMDTREGSKVKITKIFDDSPVNIAYPQTDDTNLEKLHYTELFHSKYPLHIPAVRTVHGIRATSIEFTNKKKTNNTDLFKTSIDDKRANSVSKLSTALQKLGDWILGKISRGGGGGGALTTNEENYHMCLQFKRAGDWLQVLACLSPERFGLDPLTRIKLITNDRICLLYGLKMGIDVIFTMHDIEKKEFSLVKFYKNMKERNIIEHFTNLFKSIKDPKENINDTANGNYTDSKARYIQNWKTLNETLVGNLKDNFKPENAAALTTTKEIEQYLRLILISAMRIAVFRTICPEILEGEEVGIYALLEEIISDEKEEILKSEKEDITRLINLYKRNYQILDNTISSKAGLGAAADSADVSINLFFTSFFKQQSVSKIFLSKTDIIDRIKFFGRKATFDTTNHNENGMGIFSYLNGPLSKEEKEEITAEFVKQRSNLTMEADIKQYDTALQIGIVLLNDDKERGETIFEVPNIDEIPSIMLLRAIFFPKGDYDPIAEDERFDAIPGGNKEGQSISSIRDTHAELVILAQRSQLHFGVEDLQREEASPPKRASSLQGGVEAEEEPSRKRQNPEGGEGEPPRKKGEPEETITRENLKNLFGGGGGGGFHIKKYNHNPLTTICFILWELNCYLPGKDPDTALLYKLSAIIEHIVTHDLKKLKKITSIKDVYTYLYSLEAFLLEGLSKELPNRNINHFMAGVKEEYFGFNGVNNYKKFMHLSESEIKTYVTVKPKKRTIQELIRFNDTLLYEVLKYLNVIENTLLAEQTGNAVRRVSHRAKSHSKIYSAPSIMLHSRSRPKKSRSKTHSASSIFMSSSRANKSRSKTHSAPSILHSRSHPKKSRSKRSSASSMFMSRSRPRTSAFVMNILKKANKDGESSVNEPFLRSRRGSVASISNDPGVF